MIDFRRRHREALAGGVIGVTILLVIELIKWLYGLIF